MTFDARKYPSAPSVRLPERAWPSRTLDHAPIWCSVDLRDGIRPWPSPWHGTQAALSLRRWCAWASRKFEVGFPAASQTEFDFVRALIEQKHIPADVTIQVLTQAREHLIARTFQALQGVRRAIVHVYNSTSTVQAPGGVWDGSGGREGNRPCKACGRRGKKQPSWRGARLCWNTRPKLHWH